MIDRKVSQVTEVKWHQGFLGAGHSAAAVLEGVGHMDADPFILFMDDELDLPGGPPVGGAHPHAGFEISTLVLQGDGVNWKTGDLELLTAGKGVVHTEEITSEQKLRILQVWLALPPERRWVKPFWQKIALENVPHLQTNDLELLVYSGQSNGLKAPLYNNTPLTLLDIKLSDHGSVTQQLPADHTAFIYVLKGSVSIGDRLIDAGRMAVLDRYAEDGESQVRFYSGDGGSHFVLYAARPHHHPVVSHGPFIADSKEDIVRLYSEYRAGGMPHLKDLPTEQKMIHT